MKVNEIELTDSSITQELMQYQMTNNSVDEIIPDKLNKLKVYKHEEKIRVIFNLIVKRLLDIIGSIVGIVLLIPLTLAVLIVNLLSRENGPIFYKQKRIGKNGKYFEIYKFRTMIVDADEKLNKLLEDNSEMKEEFLEKRKLKEDPRITKTGKFLRKTSLDEFPNFINVLKGEMSLVGPRAVIDGEIDLFGDYKQEVLSVKPGITGYWAANGRSNTSYQERVKMESYYVRNMNPAMDAKILCKTIVSVVRKEGAV